VFIKTGIKQVARLCLSTATVVVVLLFGQANLSVSDGLRFTAVFADDDHGDSDSDSSSSSSSSSSSGGSGGSGGSSGSDNRYWEQQQAEATHRSPSGRRDFSSAQLSRIATLRSIHLIDTAKKARFSFSVNDRTVDEAKLELKKQLQKQGFTQLMPEQAQITILEQLQ